MQLIGREREQSELNKLKGSLQPEFVVLYGRRRVGKTFLVRSFFEDKFTFEFKTMPSDEMFDDIDKMIAAGKEGWKRDGNKYSFSVMWGNGYPAPEGEREEYDGMFSITITKGEKEGMITFGAW